MSDKARISWTLLENCGEASKEFILMLAVSGAA
jgi:hypothetical protein